MADDELITRYVVVGPRYPGPANVRLRNSAVHILAIVGQFAAVEWNTAQVASDYGIPVVEVEAAHAYYRRNRDLINARLAANGPYPSPWLCPRRSFARRDRPS